MVAMVSSEAIFHTPRDKASARVRGFLGFSVYSPEASVHSLDRLKSQNSVVVWGCLFWQTRARSARVTSGTPDASVHAG